MVQDGCGVRSASFSHFSRPTHSPLLSASGSTCSCGFRMPVTDGRFRNKVATPRVRVLLHSGPSSRSPGLETDEARSRSLFSPATWSSQKKSSRETRATDTRLCLFLSLSTHLALVCVLRSCKIPSPPPPPLSRTSPTPVPIRQYQTRVHRHNGYR